MDLYTAIRDKIIRLIRRRANSIAFRIIVLIRQGYIPPGATIDIDSMKNVSIGKRFRLGKYSRLCVENNAQLCIGDDVSTGHSCTIYASTGITLEHNIRMAHLVTLVDSDYTMSADNFNSGFKTKRSMPIRISNGCLLLTGCIITKNTSIEANCVVLPYSICRGNYDTCMIISSSPYSISGRRVS